MRFLWDITIGLIFRILFSPSPTRSRYVEGVERGHWVTVHEDEYGPDVDDDFKNYG